MIQFFQVTKYFDRYAALRDVTLRVDKGECVLLTGPSGAGKTTLLKLIFGAEVPDEGQILVQNRNIARLRASDVPYLRRTMGFVLQDFKLLPQKNCVPKCGATTYYSRNCWLGGQEEGLGSFKSCWP